MVYKIVGANEESEFPPRVMTRLGELFAGKDVETATAELITELNSAKAKITSLEGATQDSGWRNIATSLVNGWVVTDNTPVRLRRIGKLCMLHSVVNGAAATASHLITVPTGFRWAIASLVLQAPNAQVVYRSNYQVDTAGRGTAIYLVHSWFTDDPWPTTLPGTAA